MAMANMTESAPCRKLQSFIGAACAKDASDFCSKGIPRVHSLRYITLVKANKNVVVLGGSKKYMERPRSEHRYLDMK